MKWIPLEDNVNPVDDDTIVHVKYVGGATSESLAPIPSSYHNWAAGLIVAYRVIDDQA